MFKNYPDHQSLDNVLDSVYVNYYKDWSQKYIIDRGPVMTKGNFQLMQKHFKKPFKCVVILRDLMDVLASYMQWYTENPDSFVNRYNLKNDEEKLSMIMNKKGAVAKDLEAIYDSKGIKTDKAVYTLCQTAVRATHTWFVLQELLGYDNVKVYDGSWIEWGNSDLPIETK